MEGLRSSVEVHPRILVVDDGLKPSAVESAAGRRVRMLLHELKELGYKILEAVSFADALANLLSDASIVLLVLDWTLGKDTDSTHRVATDLLTKARARNARLPIFLSLDRKSAHQVPLPVMQMINEFVWILEDSPRFIAGRANAAVNRYLGELLPPLAGAMVKYSSANEYSWAAPGHQGGVAFTKNPAGRIFADFMGENLFRSDMGIERGNLGSMLDHTGPMGQAEKYQAYVFGSHRTYSGVNGTSGSNRAVFSACVQSNHIALCDRNAHKSIEQGLVVSGGIPHYLIPSRNHHGIIGPIPPARLTKEAIRKGILENPLARKAASMDPDYGVVTNCTYDGLCYHAKRVEDLLADIVDRVHFDEAWFAYARFNPLYCNRFAMRGDPKDHGADRPTVFATQSTHKLLAALSSATFIHIRNGRKPIPFHVFNEAWQMHTTTSPLYAILASNDVAACMMDHGSGKALTDECIREAVSFRQSLMRAYHEMKTAGNGGWFFHPWNPWEVTDPSKGKKVAFAEAKPELLCTDPNCWVLDPNDAWHGFKDLDDGYCLLDPIKVSIVCPGMSTEGELSDRGICAAVVTAYLSQKGIVVARSTDFTILFLFSIGITKGKWGTLLSSLLSFKRSYDCNEPLDRALPDLYNQYKDRYNGMGIRDLNDQMFEFKKKHGQCDVLHRAYDEIPAVSMTPRDAFERMQAGGSELVEVNDIEGRIAAVSVIPYPPGIPMVMSGEVVGKSQKEYLETIQLFDSKFPGFELEIQGLDNESGDGYRVSCFRGGIKRKGAQHDGSAGHMDGDGAPLKKR